MGGLIFFICFIAAAVVLIGLYIEAPDDVRENIKQRIFMVLAIIFSKSNSAHSSNSEGSVDYVPQRLGGSGWLNAGPSFSNPSSAQSSVDYMQSRDPKGKYRVAERRNGRIVGGF